MKIVRLAIFLAGVMGLAMGGFTTLSSLKANVEETQVRMNESLKAQSVVLVDQFFHIVETIKALPKTNTTPTLSYVTHHAVFKMKNGQPSDAESFASADPTAQSDLDFAFQERVQDALKEQIVFSDLQVLKLSLGTFDLSEMGNKQGIFIAEPIFKTANGAVDTNALEKISVTLIDPAKAFAGIQKLSGTEISAFLLSKKGKVLAHTLSAFAGTDLRKIENLKAAIDHLFLGAQTGAVSKYTNVEGNKQAVAFIRIGTYPFAFGVEQKAKAAVLSTDWVSEQIRSGAATRAWGLAFILIAIALVAFSGVSIWANRNVTRAIEAGRANVPQRKPVDEDFSFSQLSRKNAVNQALSANASVESAAQSHADSYSASAPMSPPIPSSVSMNMAQMSLTAPESVEKAAASFAENRVELSTAKIEANTQKVAIQATRDYLKEFLARIQNGFVVETIEKELVHLSSELTESAVLLFRYHRRNQNLNLVAAAGDVRVPNYTNMQAYIRKDIEAQVENLANEGKVASVTHYGPLSKLIMGYLNVAHYEAWAVTSGPEVSGQAKLVGVLVILHAGSQSAKVRPVLAKMLKEAGNYLYAQSNRLKSRISVKEVGHAVHFDSENA